MGFTRFAERLAVGAIVEAQYLAPLLRFAERLAFGASVEAQYLAPLPALRNA